MMRLWGACAALRGPMQRSCAFRALSVADCSSDAMNNAASDMWPLDGIAGKGFKKPELHPDGTQNIPGSCVRSEGRLSIQQSYEPQGASFGTGVHNPIGLHLQSFRLAEGLESEWTASRVHEAFPGVVAGGVITALFECQGNWTAAIALMDGAGLRAPPLTVSASLQVQFLEPAPTGEVLLVHSRVLNISKSGKRIECEMVLTKKDHDVEAPGQKLAHAKGHFVKIGPMRNVRGNTKD